MASCPKCNYQTLSPTLLAEGLSAKACGSCSGALVDLLAYRAWADRAGIDITDDSHLRTVETDDTSEAILCPNCSAIMTKFRFSAETENRLDFCANCDAVWLDAGEWNQLQDLGLRERLGSVFTEPWQRHVREEIAEDKREALLRRRFGEDFARLSEMREWVQAHPKYESIMAWLRDHDDN